MIANLPKYYKIASIAGMDEALLEKRSNAISEVVKNKDLNWMLDCMRFYLKKPLKNKDFGKEIFNAINAFDTVFLEDDTDLEQQIFAGAVIGQAIIDHAGKDALAAALRVSVFGMPDDGILNKDIIDNAIQHLNNRSVAVRQIDIKVAPLPKPPTAGKEGEQTVETLNETVKSIIAYSKALATFSEQQKLFDDSRIAILKEESNIHWWLFRGHSDKKACPVAELPPLDAIFILSAELNDLITRVPEPPNVTSFFKKSWSNVVNAPETVSIKDAIGSLYTNLQALIPISESSGETYGNLTPLHFAYQKCNELGNDTSWGAAFERLSGINAESNFSCIEIGMQFLYELILFNL